MVDDGGLPPPRQPAALVARSGMSTARTAHVARGLFVWRAANELVGMQLFVSISHRYAALVSRTAHGIPGVAARRSACPYR